MGHLLHQFVTFSFHHKISNPSNKTQQDRQTHQLHQPLVTAFTLGKQTSFISLHNPKRKPGQPAAFLSPQVLHTCLFSLPPFIIFLTWLLNLTSDRKKARPAKKNRKISRALYPPRKVERFQDHDTATYSLLRLGMKMMMMMPSCSSFSGDKVKTCHSSGQPHTRRVLHPSWS